MLRLPRFELRQPRSLPEAVRACWPRPGPRPAVVAGGTDLLPNMKHELLLPPVVVFARAHRGAARGSPRPTTAAS